MSERLHLPGRRRLIIPGPAPHFDGFPIPIAHLDLPDSQLDPTDEESYNNHHQLWTARVFGRFALYRALRNLEAYQEEALMDVHVDYHRRYDPVTPPSPRSAMDRLDDAYHDRELLRTGPIHLPTYELITTELYNRLKQDYESIRDSM